MSLLRQKTADLRRMRDLLLSRLMTGEAAVSGVHVADGRAAV
jgi:hypothetical protein